LRASENFIQSSAEKRKRYLGVNEMKELSIDEEYLIISALRMYAEYHRNKSADYVNNTFTYETCVFIAKKAEELISKLENNENE
jgi:hypothetical protein